MNIFITGGCGYIGFSLVEELLSMDDVSSITVYDSLVNSNVNFFFGQRNKNSDKIKFIKGNILDNYTLKKSLIGHEIVVHLAGRVSTPFSQSSMHDFDQVNNWGTANLVSEVESNSDIKRLIHVSSISVYGDTNGIAIDETSLTSPKTAYGNSKLRAEKHLKRLSSVKDSYIVRAANVYGYNPCIRLDSVINKLMFDAHYNNKIEIFGSGRQLRPFIEVTELSQLIASYCHSNISFPDILNAVTTNQSINDVAQVISSIYPQVNRVHLDQHLEMRSISATKSKIIEQYIDAVHIEDQLVKFKNLFRL